MKITVLKCAVIGKNPVVRIVTDEGISGFGEVKQYKPDLKRSILHFCEALIGQGPTNVERVMLRIRQRGAFKPWGSAVSAIEMALWDVAGEAAGVPVYKLLGGKVPRPCLRLQRPLAPAASPSTPIGSPMLYVRFVPVVRSKRCRRPLGMSTQNSACP